MMNFRSQVNSGPTHFYFNDGSYKFKAKTSLGMLLLANCAPQTSRERLEVSIEIEKRSLEETNLLTRSLNRLKPV